VDVRTAVAEQNGGEEMLAVYLADPHVLMRLEPIRGQRPADLRGPILET
jgi:hypothetical protein